MFELQTIPAPAGLAPLGAIVEIREIKHSAVQAALSAGAKIGRPSDGLLAATLFVDGAAIGLDGLGELPGRFYGAFSEALALTIKLHGMRVDGDAASPPPATPDPVAGESGNV